MAEHPNVQRIRDAYDAFATGDLDAALKDLAPDAVFHLNGQGRLSGDRRGRDDISSALVEIFTATEGTQKLDVSEVFADDRHGVVRIHETASRPGGESLAVDEAHVIAFDGQGRIAELWDLPTDPDTHDRFFDAL